MRVSYILLAFSCIVQTLSTTPTVAPTTSFIDSISTGAAAEGAAADAVAEPPAPATPAPATPAPATPVPVTPPPATPPPVPVTPVPTTPVPVTPPPATPPPVPVTPVPTTPAPATPAPATLPPTTPAPTPLPTKAAPWTPYTCATQTGKPACSGSLTTGCAVVHSCTGPPDNKPTAVSIETGYTCCLIRGSSSYTCAGGSACQSDGQVAVPTPASTPFSCAKGKVACNGLPGPYHGAISATPTGYFCCYADPAACSTSRGVHGTNCTCEASGVGSVCTAWPTSAPTMAPTTIVVYPTSGPTKKGAPSGPSNSGGSTNAASGGGGGRLNGGDYAGIIIACLVVIGVASFLVAKTMQDHKVAEQRDSFQRKSEIQFQEMKD